jgi:ribosomal protein L12E/L44/L45/RPP1/RPP2
MCVQAVIKEKTQQKVVEAQVRLEITDREVERQKKELEGVSMAELMAQKNQSEAVRVGAQAEADKIKMIGESVHEYIQHGRFRFPSCTPLCQTDLVARF